MEREDGALVVGVDTGGTFTDVFASDGRVFKVPSTPVNPVLGILEGLRAAEMGRGDAVAHGTTVATNAILERKGARTVLLTTEGFEDVLEIRRQNRPKIYDLYARWPEPLVPVERRLGVPERLDWQGTVLCGLEREALERLVGEAIAQGAESVAVCLLFSYANPEHEEECGAALASTGLPVSLSYRIAPQYGEFERTSTTVVNAYVVPVMRRYLTDLQIELTRAGVRDVHVMHSNGGLVHAETAADRPVGTILSGPAAGVVGAHAVASAAGHDEIITFDMGGTSTDVAVVPGEILEGTEGEVASFPLLVPMLTIETVGAGGGSIARVDTAGALHVGPASAGADPGPAAYGRGEEPTVTDANLVLGRLSASGLLGGAMALQVDRARAAIGRIAERLGTNLEEAAWAIVRLANSNMERAVRTVTQQRAYDPRGFTLVPFGGAGPLHAAELAEGLGIITILVPPHPGVMAALGLTVPDLVRDFRRTVLLPCDASAVDRILEIFGHLEAQARDEMREETLFGPPRFKRAVDMRYVGQSFDLPVPFEADAEQLRADFHAAYQRRYGYVMANEPAEIVNARVRVVLPRLEAPHLLPAWPQPPRALPPRDVSFGSPLGATDVRAERSAVHWRPSLAPGEEIAGPAIIEQYDTTTVVPPGWTARVDRSFNLLLTHHTG